MYVLGYSVFKLALCLLIFEVPNYVTCSVYKNLKHFETLHASQFSHNIVKRGVKHSDHPFNRIREVSFSTLGRDFRLILTPKRGLLHSKFKAITVDGDGQEKPVFVDHENFYDGRLFGEVSSVASVHLEDGVMTATIHAPDETYHIEPSWRHLPHLDNQSMIVYRESDIHFSWNHGEGRGDTDTWPRTCGYVKEGEDKYHEDDDDGYDGNDQNDIEVRKKRQAEQYEYTPTKTRCPLLLVADYRFYQEMGGSNTKTTINYLISLIDRVHKIYNDTTWQDRQEQDGFKGMGFVIKKIVVHSDPNKVRGGEAHYNMVREKWDVRNLLEVFSRYNEINSFCLGHLFTHQTFDRVGSTVLGLAYIASPRPNAHGGICTSGQRKFGGHCGFTSSALFSILREKEKMSALFADMQWKGANNFVAPTVWNKVFSREYSHKDFCLAHLFTDLKFEGGILGLAYVGSPRRNSVGGICTPEYFKNGYTLYLNSGLSSSRNHYGQRVITREADLVTAHEFGHNWGSEHDPDIPECSPSASQGGSYLMYTYSVSGYDINNKRFSPCSLRSIRKVLQAKSGRCFSEPEESFCGNLRVEGDEECDAGLLGTEDNDGCCDKNCKLRRSHGAVCSDKNSPCCQNCQFMPAQMKCRDAQPATCEQESRCTGGSSECPRSLAMTDGTPCLERGQCRRGKCVPYCETQGLQSCMCDIIADACKRCCRMNLNDTCFPVDPQDILPDGTPCIQGFCNKGMCEKTVQDVVERFWDIIEDININKVLVFLKDNIVGTVILVTAIIWIPASCVVSYVDRRRKKMQVANADWRNSSEFHRGDSWHTVSVSVPRQRPPATAPLHTTSSM